MSAKALFFLHTIFLSACDKETYSYPLKLGWIHSNLSFLILHLKKQMVEIKSSSTEELMLSFGGQRLRSRAPVVASA